MKKIENNYKKINGIQQQSNLIKNGNLFGMINK